MRQVDRVSRRRTARGSPRRGRLRGTWRWRERGIQLKFIGEVSGVQARWVMLSPAESDRGLATNAVGEARREGEGIVGGFRACATQPQPQPARASERAPSRIQGIWDETGTDTDPQGETGHSAAGTCSFRWLWIGTILASATCAAVDDNAGSVTLGPDLQPLDLSPVAPGAIAASRRGLRRPWAGAALQGGGEVGVSRTESPCIDSFLRGPLRAHHMHTPDFPTAVTLPHFRPAGHFGKGATPAGSHATRHVAFTHSSPLAHET